MRRASEKALLSALSVIFLSALFARFIIYPLTAKRGQLREKAAEAALSLNYYLQLLQREDSIRREHDHYFASLGPAAQAVDAVILFQELEGLAAESGLKVNDIRQVASGPSQRAGINILIQLEGLPQGYARFLYFLKESRLLFAVDSLNLKGAPAGTLLEARIVVSRPQ